LRWDRSGRHLGRPCYSRCALVATPKQRRADMPRPIALTDAQLTAVFDAARFARSFVVVVSCLRAKTIVPLMVWCMSDNGPSDCTRDDIAPSITGIIIVPRKSLVLRWFSNPLTHLPSLPGLARQYWAVTADGRHRPFSVAALLFSSEV
jgi:hypothetical protein